MSKSVKTTLLLLSFVILGFAIAGAVGVKAGNNDDGRYRRLLTKPFSTDCAMESVMGVPVSEE